jgi:hypothetical protein
MRQTALLKNTLLQGVTLSALLIVASLGSAFAQNAGDQKNQDQNKPAAAADSREAQKKADEFEEAAKAINGPAGNPECVWLGRRVVTLMWNDDLDTAFRHLDLYDRFGCPGGHIQAAFRCVVRFAGTIDPKIPGSLNNRVQACWINPAAQPQPAAATPAPAPEPAPAPAK